MTWRMLDLFSGIGGFSLAAQWCWGDELEIVAFCEIDKFCQKVLRKHWPNVPIIEDVRDVKIIQDPIKAINGRTETTRRQTINWNSGSTSNLRNINLLTGGFPCQPFSVAGKRKGKEDNRFLWPEMFAVIKEIRPCWVVAENVAGIIRMALDDCLSDLEGEGYSTQAIIIPACAVNAPHRRDRVWIVAYTKQSCGRGRFSERLSNSDGKTTRTESESLQSRNRQTYSGDIKQGSQDVADSFINSEGTPYPQGSNEGWSNGQQDNGNCMGNDFGNGSQTFGWWSTEPSMGELVNGLSNRLVRFRGRVAKGIPDRVNKLKALGNSVIPQIAYQIFKAIKEIENRK